MNSSFFEHSRSYWSCQGQSLPVSSRVFLGQAHHRKHSKLYAVVTMSATNDGQQQPVFVSSVTRIFADGKSNAETKNNTSQRSSLEDNSFLPRLVSEHPLDSNASIETVIEPVSSSSTTTGSRRFRVVIRNGPDPVLSHIHASFLLPEKTQLPSLWRWKETGGKPSLLAWTHFDNIGEGNKGSTDESNLSTFLCVLVHPELLSIYNVYPRPNSGWTVQQEGWSVPLPAEFSSIFALPGGGLLLQRSPDEELNCDFIEYKYCSATLFVVSGQWFYCVVSTAYAPFPACLWDSEWDHKTVPRRLRPQLGNWLGSSNRSSMDLYNTSLQQGCIHLHLRRLIY